MSPTERRENKRIFNALEAMNLRVDLLLFSPFLRSVETADLLRAQLKGDSSVTELLDKAPGQPLLEALAQGQRVAAVGNANRLGALMAWLVIGDTRLGPNFDLSGGGLAWLEGKPAPGKMKLRGMYSAAALRLLL